MCTICADGVFLAPVDLKLQSTIGTVRPEIQLPENVRNLSGHTQADVQFSMPGLQQRLLTVILDAEYNVVFLNAPDGWLPRLTTRQMGVNIRGPSDIVLFVTAEHIHFVIDLEGADGRAVTFDADVYVVGIPGVEVTGGQPHPVSVRFVAADILDPTAVP